VGARVQQAAGVLAGLVPALLQSWHPFVAHIFNGAGAALAREPA
jgi:hypothetical protein